MSISARRILSQRLNEIEQKQGAASMFQRVGQEVGDMITAVGEIAAPKVEKWQDVKAGAEQAGVDIKSPGWKNPLDWFKDPSKVLGDKPLVGQREIDGKWTGETKTYTANDLQTIGGFERSDNPLVRAQKDEMIQKIGKKGKGKANTSSMTRSFLEQKMKTPIIAGQEVPDWIKEESTPGVSVLERDYRNFKNRFDLAASPSSRKTDSYDVFKGNINMPDIPKDKGIGKSIEKYVPPSMPKETTSAIENPDFNESSLADRTEILNQSPNNPINDAGYHKWNQTEDDWATTNIGGMPFANVGSSLSNYMTGRENLGEI